MVKELLKEIFSNSEIVSETKTDFKDTPITMTVSRCMVKKENIEEFKNKTLVKFIFFNSDYWALASDTTISEIHRFRAKYRGNTYIRLPLKIVKEMYDPYPKGIVVTEETEDGRRPDGYAVVSKHDLWANFYELKYSKKDEKVAFGDKLCRETVKALSDMLNGDVFHIVTKHIYTDAVITDMYVTGDSSSTFGDGIERMNMNMKKKNSAQSA